LLVHSTSPTWRRLERVLSSTSLGLVSQALAFVVGVLVIRSLDRTEYVSYSLSGAIVAAVAIIADSGIASTLTAAAARAENATRFRALLTAALRRRRTVWGVAIAPTLALLVYLLLKAGIAPVPALIVAALTGALSYNSLSIGLAAIDRLL
jgi:O-antigen/teichoic acid export membrane protein